MNVHASISSLLVLPQPQQCNSAIAQNHHNKVLHYYLFNGR